MPRARHAVIEFARRWGLHGTLLEDVGLAVSEAVTNVVLHAYDGLPGQLRVMAYVHGERVWVLVGDDGRGLRGRADSPGLGMGLQLIGGLCDQLEVDRGRDGGTELRMGFRVGAAPGADDIGWLEPARGMSMPRSRQLRGSVASARSPA